MEYIAQKVKDLSFSRAFNVRFYDPGKKLVTGPLIEPPYTACTEINTYRRRIHLKAIYITKKI
jgi:hypothetical protein